MPEIKRLHPTLKKCKCGFIGQRTQLYKHFETEKFSLRSSTVTGRFYELHGEVPLNEDEGDEYCNRKWLEGTHSGYND